MKQEQQKIIDLIKTGETKNLRLAFDLDQSQNLGVNSIYFEIYKKWDFLIESDFEREHLEYFPLLMAKGNPLVRIRRFQESDFEDGINGICDLLIDLLKFFFYEENEIIITSMDAVRENDYCEKHKIQLTIHQKTGIPIENITINETPLPF